MVVRHYMLSGELLLETVVVWMT